MYVFNPIYNKTPQGPSLKGGSVAYNLKINKLINPTKVNFCYCKDFCAFDQKIEMDCSLQGDYFNFLVKVTFNEAGLYWYYFEVYQGEHKFYLQATNSFEVEPTGELKSKFQQLVYLKNSKTSNTFKGGVMYHIFVDRFCKSGEVTPRFDLILRDDWGGQINKNSNDFKVINKECFGGNLKGITSKLNYLKSLNINTIYLSPIFEANSYHKYDTANYLKIDSMFGSQKDFANLIKKAKEKGINIILDGVFNHTGSDSIYFNKNNNYNELGAYQSKNSKYYNWYDFQNFPQKYSSWWDIETLPQIKKPSNNFNNFIAGKSGVIEKYMNMGLFGFRLDVVDELAEETLIKICKRIKKIKKDGVVIGEVWEDASNKIAYDFRKNYFLGNQLDSVMNYPVKDAIINYVLTGNSQNLKNALFMIVDHYPKEICHNLMNILGTHDTSRILSVLNENCDQEKAIKLLKIASLLQFVVVGVPCIFYGDEQGVLGNDAPFCRVCFPWNNQNKKIKKWYEFLGILRKDKIFKKGDMNIICSENGLFGIERLDGRNKIVVYTNCSNEDKVIKINENLVDYVTKKKVVNEIMLKNFDFLILKNS